MVDLINFQKNGLDDVMADELEIGLIQKVSDVVFASSEEVIKADDVIAAVDEVFAQVATYKSSSAGDQNTVAFHARLGLDRRAVVR